MFVLVDSTARYSCRAPKPHSGAEPRHILKLRMRKAAKYIFVSTAALALGLSVGWSPWGRAVDLWAYDFLLRLHPPEPGPSASVILAIDEETLGAYGGLLHLRAPLAKALDIVCRHGPAAVAVDIILSEPGEEDANQALEQALAGCPNVVPATHLTATADPEAPRWEEPLLRFARHAAALGHAHAEPDEDGVTRRIQPAKAAGRDRRWAMALETFRLASGARTIRETGRGLEVGDTFIPLGPADDSALRIRFRHPASPIEQISVKTVLEDPAAAAAVRGRTVFAGVRITGGLDRYLMTPYSFGEAMSGVEINANAYETLAAGRFLADVSGSTELLACLLLAAALGLLYAKGTRPATIAAAGGVLAAAHLVPVAALRGGYVFPPAALLTVGWLGFLGSGVYRHLVVRKRLGQAESQRDRYQRAVGYVTHEMRTPLTAIQGSSEIISRYPLSDEKRREIADMIHRESKRLGRMMETFLGVEQLSAGERELACEAVPAAEILGAALDRARPAAEKKNIEIERDFAEPAPIWGDVEFLEYACYNLIANAVKYSPARGKITVRAKQHQDHVYLSVEDRGYGMDESEIKNIFQRFYRTERAEQSGTPGTGLGLALVEEIVDRHGGSIEVESRVNEGSRFTVSLPAADSRSARVS